MEEMQQHNMSWIEVSNLNAEMTRKYLEMKEISLKLNACAISLGSILEACCRHFGSVPTNSNVYICVCVLFTQK